MSSRIVAGFDGSAASLAAVRFAAAAAAAAGAALRVLHSRLPIAGYTLLLPAGRVARGDPARWLVERACDALRHDYPGLDVSTVATDVGAAVALLRASRSAGALVIGRTGHGTGRRSPVGSTARRLTAGASAR
ncbi:universal stress protein [Dactylosporangium sp. CA-233914]|uniref:universal stress protein n=1 Tax=Dactylosporangium sp. CA-233914 TaxID=3239934 RepID=UPI003D8F03B7